MSPEVSVTARLETLVDQLAAQVSAELKRAEMEYTAASARFAKLRETVDDSRALQAAEAEMGRAGTILSHIRRKSEGLAFVRSEMTFRPALGHAGGRKIRTARVPVRDAAGHDLRPNPIGVRTPAELMAAVRAYRVWAGNPSFRDMARIGDCGVGYSRLCTALGKDSDMLPRQEVIEAAIKGCGGTDADVGQFVTAWRQLAMGEQRPGSARLSVVPPSAADRPGHAARPAM